MKQRHNTYQLLGWLVAIAIGATMLASGFVQAQEKSGVVDLNRVIQESDLGKSNTTKLNNALKLRRDLIDFLTTYMVLTTEQAETLRQLTLKDAQTDADKAQIEKIKKDVMESDKKRQELMAKTTLTDSDRQLLQDYSQRARINEERAANWDKDFSADLNDLRDKLQQDTINQAKTSLGTVAKGQGFTIIYESTVAPFGVNDVTDATIKALNARH